MLKKLTVRNLAVIERAEVEFGAGLNVLTGETGAGKSVLMGALELALGARAEASQVRDGAVEAEVEAEFDGCVVRRTVTREGRSRAWVDDESVSVVELKERAHALVDIHGPRANQRLLEDAFARDALDVFGGVGRGDFEKAFCRYRELVERRAGVGEALSAEELEFLAFQVSELREAELSDDDENLAERHAAAAHARELIESANEVTESLGGERGAAETLIALQPRFRSMARHFPAAGDWGVQAEELTLKIQELSRTIADAASKLDADETDFDALDARLTLVNRLKRKYRVETVAALAAVRDEKSARLDEAESRDARLRELEASIAGAEKEMRSAGAELTKARGRVADRFAKAVMAELRDLGFLQAKFSVALEPCEPSVAGLDRVVYLFEPNPGETARPLAAIASSGEIARVMLAIKVAGLKGRGVDRAQPPTLVFDEIDANIGGEVGKAVGEKMRSVASGRQVIAITHLPQSAVYGDRQLKVSKTVSGGRTRTTVTEVKGSERVSEIARMLGGEQLTSVVRRHAEELLEISG